MNYEGFGKDKVSELQCRGCDVEKNPELPHRGNICECCGVVMRNVYGGVKRSKIYLQEPTFKQFVKELSLEMRAIPVRSKMRRKAFVASLRKDHKQSP